MAVSAARGSGWRCDSPASALLAICAAAFVLRLGVGLHLRGATLLESGYDFFFDLARGIAGGGGMVDGSGVATAFRVPGYPLFLALVTLGHKVNLPVIVAQSMVGTATVCLTGVLARDLFGRRTLLPAAGMAAIYPYYVVHDTALQDTSLYTLLALLAVVLGTRARHTNSLWLSAATGLALGIAVLTRANLALFAMLVPLCLAIPARQDGDRRGRRYLAAAICAAALTFVVAPWMGRSYLLTGSTTISTQNGFFLWLGNNPLTFSRYPRESIDESSRVALAALSSEETAEQAKLAGNEAAVDAWFWRKGVAYIGEHPARTLVMGAYKVIDAFGWLPSPRKGWLENLAMAMSYGPITVLGVIGLWICRRDWREQALLYAQFLAFAAVTAVFFGHTSYRVYLDVYLMAFAAAGAVRLLGSVSRSSSST